MTSKNSSERVTIFIDGSNFYYALKSARGNARIDFRYLVDNLVADRSLIRVYYYNAPVNQAEEPQRDNGEGLGWPLLVHHAGRDPRREDV